MLVANKEEMDFPSLGMPYQREFQYPEYLDVIFWINIHVGLPLTFLVIALCFTVRLDDIPSTYYVNLLVSNLIQIIISFLCADGIIWMRFCYNVGFIVYTCSGTASFCFRMIISLERFLFVSRPHCHFIRQAKGFVTICLSVWIFSGFLIFLLGSFWNGLPQICFLFIAAFLSVFFIALTLKSLCTSASIPVKQKFRITGALVLLLVNHIVISFPTDVYFVLLHFNLIRISTLLITEIFFTLSLHSPLIDLIMFVFMTKGPFIKLLMGLCCFRKETAAVNESSSSSV